MSDSLTAEALMAKAETATASANALLALGDVDGACNRAYYAMFDAARAALLATNGSVRFSGCNPTAFDFTTEASARTASQALLDQVFIDGLDGSFDSDSSKTYGCSSTDCWALTPYLVDINNQRVFVASARNFYAGFGTDTVVSGGAINYTTDTTGSSNNSSAIWVWADWSVQRQTVPEPNTLVLLGLGLIGISVIRRRARGQ